VPRLLSYLILLVAGAGIGVAAAAGRNASHRATVVRRPEDPLVARTAVFGRSARGKALSAIELGDADAKRKALVVGVIHGNESAGRTIAALLRLGPRPSQADLWIVPDLNPDGVTAGTRQNAHLVDLNRNFPFRWRRIGHPGDLQYSGPRPLSEPESRAAAELIRRVRPSLSIWFHQPLGLVDESGGQVAIERRFASLTGLPLRRLTRYPGSAVGWENHSLPGTTAFVVELPPGRLIPGHARRYSFAVQRLVRGMR
jgi:murein peptide amidase A